MKSIYKIDSINNSRIKKWRKLIHRKYREQDNLMLVEGERLVNEALVSSLQVEAVLLNENNSGNFSLSESIPCYQCTNEIFQSIVTTKNPQGVAAIVKIPRYNIDDLLKEENKIATLLLIDSIQDPGNLGTIIRTAEAGRTDGIIIGKGSVDPYNPKVVRSAMGSLFRTPLVQMDLATIIPVLSTRGFMIVATSLKATSIYHKVNYPKKVAFLLGNEGEGVGSELFIGTDEEVVIPIAGQTESLNVAIAAGIILFERVRQLDEGLPPSRPFHPPL